MKRVVIAVKNHNSVTRLSDYMYNWIIENRVAVDLIRSNGKEIKFQNGYNVDIITKDQLHNYALGRKDLTVLDCADQDYDPIHPFSIILDPLLEEIKTNKGVG